MSAPTELADAVTPALAERPMFDVCGPLPSGTTVLEASAGTGKTFTIAALAARYVAEDVATLPELMLVTFGRMASTELRTRVRERLVSLETALGDGGSVDPDDAVARLLADVAPDERRARHDRVARALTDFDTATIATTHEFCLSMLDGLGVLGDREPQALFVEQVDELTDEVATDLYLQRYATTGRAPMRHDEARRLARAAVESAATRLVPGPDDLDDAPGHPSDAAERVAYAAAVRTEVERRKRAGQLFTYDDMLTRLRDTLADPRHGRLAAARLRQRYRVVMVDEFQDTDPVQWDILRRAFSGHTTMVLIGDPKQAIYGFRGADVFSYLDAVATAGTVATLGTSRRSDADLLTALHALMGGAALGEDAIVVTPVSPHHIRRRLLAGPDPGADPGQVAPLRVRVWPHAPDDDQVPRVGTLRPAIRDDLVADVTRLLASDLRLDLGGAGPRPVCPADVAVLVRTNQAGEDLRTRLVAASVPAVVHAARSVFASEAAADWRSLLTALDQPRQTHVRRAALTCFVGWSVERLALADEQELVELSQQVRWWRRVLVARGVAALMETVSLDHHVPERLLGERGGVRRLTDLRHVADSLHAAMTARQLGVGALVEWLTERVTEARREAGADGSRRLDTDADAVTIVTVHRSKGLEYPIVYLPDAWDGGAHGSDEGAVLRLHEPRGSAADGAPRGRQAVLDVGGRWAPGRPQRYRRSQEEEAGEDLRLLYVALTRAQCQVVTWWAPSFNTPGSALQRFLHRDRLRVGVPAPAYPLSEGDAFSAPGLGPHVALEPYVRRDPVPWRGSGAGPAELTVRTFDRALDLAWRRTSYSALTAAAHGLDLAVPGVGSEPEATKEDDEAVADVPGAGVGTSAARAPSDTSGSGSAWDTVSPMADLPSGTDFGTAVHAVLEEVDPAAPDLAAAVRSACHAVLARTGATTMTPDALAAGLLPAYETPLGPLAYERALRDVARRDQLAELAFELPLSGGDVPTRDDLALGDLAPLLRRHLGPGDPLTAYADRLVHPVLAEQRLRGYLTGSIDVVLRVRDEAGTPRYLVVDYKTNRLGPFDGRPLTLRPYAPVLLAEAMMAAHYPLQALLYAVAVHRMLRWRQSGYDPEVHLGGVLYLFVRGMAGPQTPRVDGVPAGVFSWRPPAALVTELSDLLAGGSTPTAPERSR